MWKAFAELIELGWLKGRLPRMVAVQASGCAPIVRAFDAGAEYADEWIDAVTVAAGIRVPAAIGDFLILRAIRESGGFAIAVDDSDIVAAQQKVAASDGLLMGPEGAATYAAYQVALRNGLVDSGETAVLFNCGSALKYPMPAVSAFLDRTKPVDAGILEKALQA
jgi:threonine synthase